MGAEAGRADDAEGVNYTLNQVRRKLREAKRSSKAAERGMHYTRTHLMRLREMLGALETSSAQALRVALKEEYESIATAARDAQQLWPSWKLAAVVEFLGDPPREGR